MKTNSAVPGYSKEGKKAITYMVMSIIILHVCILAGAIITGCSVLGIVPNKGSVDWTYSTNVVSPNQ
jgi:hypothetical protein